MRKSPIAAIGKFVKVSERGKSREREREREREEREEREEKREEKEEKTLRRPNKEKRAKRLFAVSFPLQRPCRRKTSSSLKK